jgi:hypothetical protein
MTKIGHVDPNNWNSNEKELRFSAYANAPVFQTQRIYEAFDKDALEFIEMAIWNPSIISGTKFHKPMFDCIISYKKKATNEFDAERAKNEFNTKRLDSLVRSVEDITRLDIHYHELIEDLFGCDVNDIEDHNTSPEWNYANEVKYTQSQLDNALEVQKHGSIQRSELALKYKKEQFSWLNVLYFIIGFVLSWYIFT